MRKDLVQEGGVSDVTPVVGEHPIVVVVVIFGESVVVLARLIGEMARRRSLSESP
jgi:hypothetical protein